MRLEKGDWNGAVSLNNRKKVGPVLVLCFFISFVVCLLVFCCCCCCCCCFFLLGEFISFNMYSYSTFVIVVVVGFFFIILSGK